jgi:FAD linked oxidases, C-terminal domain
MGEGTMLMMERIKTALDSKNILNPGKVLDVRGNTISNRSATTAEK